MGMNFECVSKLLLENGYKVKNIKCDYYDKNAYEGRYSPIVRRGASRKVIEPSMTIVITLVNESETMILECVYDDLQMFGKDMAILGGIVEEAETKAREKK